MEQTLTEMAPRMQPKARPKQGFWNMDKPCIYVHRYISAAAAASACYTALFDLQTMRGLHLEAD